MGGGGIVYTEKPIMVCSFFILEKSLSYWWKVSCSCNKISSLFSKLIRDLNCLTLSSPFRGLDSLNSKSEPRCHSAEPWSGYKS